MFWRRIDRLTGADPLTDLDHAIKSRIAVAYTAIFTLMGVANALILTFLVESRPGMAELGLISAAIAAALGGVGLKLRRPNLTIAMMIGLCVTVLFIAAWANRGSFPPASLYLPGILLGAYIAWGARAALYSVIPLGAYFALVLVLASRAEGSAHQFSPGEMLTILVSATALSCFWIVMFGSSFRSATSDARRGLAATNEKLERALIAAQEANRAKSDFIANMGHEVRTPLNGVLGMTSIMQQDKTLSEEHHRHLDLIAQSGTTLLEMLNEVLDLSKIEAGALEFEERAFDLSDLIRNTREHWRSQAEVRGVKMLLDGDLQRPIEVMGDPLRMRQILNNLLANAVKFTPAGQITVSCDVADGEDAGTCRIRLAVRDTGVGIPTDKLESIFDAFTQVDASTTRKYGGTGLGLAICRRLSRQMGGELTCSSAPGRGSTFTLEVTLRRAAGIPAAATPAALEGKPPLPPARILIVDDVATNQVVLRAMAQQVYAGSELHVDCAGSGREAVNRASASAYDIVLMDIQMPEMDGFSAMHCIRETRKSRDAKIVAVTALVSEASRRRCEEAGFSAYLAKPVDMVALRDTLERLSMPKTAPLPRHPLRKAV